MWMKTTRPSVGSRTAQGSELIAKIVSYTFTYWKLLSLIRAAWWHVGEWTCGENSHIFKESNILLFLRARMPISESGFGAQPSYCSSDHKFWAGPSLLLNLQSSPQAVSAPLNHPEPIWSHPSSPDCPGITQHILALPPRLQLGFIAAWNAWYVHRLARPLHPWHTHTAQSTMQATSPDLGWWFFHSKVNSTGWSGTDACGEIEFTQTSPVAPCPLSACPSPHPRAKWRLEGQVTICEFTSAWLHLQAHWETSPLCGVALRNRVACLKYSCRASLDEKTHSSPGAPTFSAEEV